MAESIADEQEDIVLIGHSFGGIISQEIARFRKIKQVILISSIRSKSENPFHFKIIGPLYLHKLFRKKLIINSLKLWAKNHGYETAEEQYLFKAMVNNQSNQYLQWALDALSNWRMEESTNNTSITQIHGALDKTFPIRLIKSPDHVVKTGSHFMVYKQPELVSDLILGAVG